MSRLFDWLRGPSPDADDDATPEVPSPDPTSDTLPVPPVPAEDVDAVGPDEAAGAVPPAPPAEEMAVLAAAADPVEPATAPDVVPPAPPAGALDAGLARTRGGFVARLRGLFGAVDDDGWEEIEETLIAGDVGALVASEVVEAARRRHDLGGVEAAVRAELARMLVPRDAAWGIRPAGPGLPAVVLVVGVNGTGKTTTIGKLAALVRAEGRSVVLAAADTFRAAAIDQLRIWAERTDAAVVAHAPGADPGAVVYDALDAAMARGSDVVIADTAGRLHTKTNLMDELAKIRRIVDRRLPGAVPETLFVLDATTGQNGLAQARAFHDAVGLTGIVLTKLDSTAKGGIVFAVERTLGIPVRFVGVGEQAGDLLAFDPDAFVAALFA